MKKSSRTRANVKLVSAITLGFALCAAASASVLSGVSASSFRTGESATAATQRKSGGHTQSPAQAPSGDSDSVPQGAKVTQAKGTFEAKLEPQGESDKAEGATLARMSIEKKLHGDLEGTSKGTMLTAVTDVKGSAGYVAIERVTGTLNGKTGSFVLQHSSTLTRGTPWQSITVVPDSGTGQLAGITGNFLVIIADGKHSYQFDYTLPAGQ